MDSATMNARKIFDQALRGCLLKFVFFELPRIGTAPDGGARAARLMRLLWAYEEGRLG